MSISVADLINNIENGTLADAEEVFNDLMDVKAGNALDSYRQQVAANIFNGEEDAGDEYDDQFDDEDLDLSGEDDAEI